MQRLWGLFWFFAVVGCTTGGHAEAPEKPKPEGDKPLQMAAPSPGETVKLQLSAASEGYVCAEDSDSFLMLGLTAAEVARSDRQPMNLAVVIDRSGSMASEDKLEHVKRAATFLIENLQATDRIALVSYDDSVRVLARSQLLGHDQKRLIRKIESLEPGNMTNIEGGLREGYDQVLPGVQPEVISRVVLLSDGLANVGQSDPRELGLIARNAAARGVSTTAMGVGVDYSEDTMMQVAEHGRGNYHFIGNPTEIPALFAKELRELKATVAQDAVVQLDLPAGSIVERVYGYDQADVGNARLSLPIGDLWSGDNRRIVVRVRSKAGSPRALLAKAHVRYRNADGAAATARLATADASMRCVKDAAEVAALRRSDVQNEVELVTSAEVMDIAMQDVNAGRKDEAKRKLDDNMRMLAPRAASSPVLREQVSKLQKAREELDAFEGVSAESAAVQAYVKGNRASSKAMQKRK